MPFYIRFDLHVTTDIRQLVLMRKFERYTLPWQNVAIHKTVSITVTKSNLLTRNSLISLKNVNMSGQNFHFQLRMIKIIFLNTFNCLKRQCLWLWYYYFKRSTIQETHAIKYKNTFIQQKIVQCTRFRDSFILKIRGS